MKYIINLQGCVWTEEYAKQYYGTQFDSRVENNLIAYIDDETRKILLDCED